ncbi:MAG TPA: Ppx/GppA phosphatase family protein [Gaiellaceae bacterium]|nr:Ppx/GppA phosphatase family protein [Gaiellaceae bacterium]
MTRVAAVDLGTNSTRLLVADVEDGHVEEIERRLAITQLGEDVDRRRRLLPTAIARVRNTLVEYRRTAERHGAERVLAIATSAVRDAENGEAFLGEVEWSYGFATQLLDGDEEALLTFRGVSAGRDLEDGTLLVDIGGGSTELVVAEAGGVGFHDSLEIGCVRLTERFGEDVEACARQVRDALPTLDVAQAIGVSGTVTALAALDLGLVAYDPGLVEGHRLSRDGVERQLERLAALPLEERRRVPGLEPERAPVIVAGAVILQEVLDAYGLAEIEASERDILDGAALAAAELPEPTEDAAPPGAYTCC